MVQLSATRCSCVSPVSFAAIIVCVASPQVFIVVVIHFLIGSVRKPLDTPSYTLPSLLGDECHVPSGFVVFFRDCFFFFR
jgi:hypothetical protein